MQSELGLEFVRILALSPLLCLLVKFTLSLRSHELEALLTLSRTLCQLHVALPLLPLLLQNRLLLLQRQPICILSPFVLCEMLGKRGQSGAPGFRYRDPWSWCCCCTHPPSP